MRVSSYQTDFYAWTQEQCTLLKAQRWDQVDIENIIEEIETLGRKERQELRNRLAVLLCHLLKWQFQAQRQSSSWLSIIREQRIQIKLLLEDSPSLNPYLEAAFTAACELGLALAIRETRLGESIFPTECPYSLQQALDPRFLLDNQNA